VHYHEQVRTVPTFAVGSQPKHLGSRTAGFILSFFFNQFNIVVNATNCLEALEAFIVGHVGREIGKGIHSVLVHLIIRFQAN
jgi:hypothetical protein